MPRTVEKLFRKVAKGETALHLSAGFEVKKETPGLMQTKIMMERLGGHSSMRIGACHGQLP